jgi:hypothetical protein
MTFPVPYIPAYDAFGEWELFSNTTTHTYPTGLQTGDIAIFLQASSRDVVGTTTIPDPPPIPTDATELDVQNRTGSFSDKFGSGANRGTSRISFKALTSADNGGTIAATTTGDSIRVLIFRCTIPASAPAAEKVGSSGTASTYSATIDFVTPGYLPPFPAIYSLRIRGGALSDWTTTFDTVTQTAYEATASGAAFTARTRTNFRLSDADLASVAISVGGTETIASQHLHQPYTLRKS